jgi:membrane protein YqaA with SNARE-associated domain
MSSRIAFAQLILMHSPLWKFIHSAALLIGLGLLDSSFIPLPGSLDALVIFYVSRHPRIWLYFVLMATVGSVVGGYVTYRVSRKGGEEALRKKLGKRADKVVNGFSRYGFWSVFLGAIAPPPVPTTAFVVAAGALQYSLHKFVAALASGRFIRFMLVAAITKYYGQGIFRFFARYYKPALWMLIAVAVAGGIVGLWFYLRQRRRKRADVRQPQPQSRAA